MSNTVFNALIVEEADGQFVRRIGEKAIDELPVGEVLIEVHYSSLNYKDALSATGHKGVTRNFPHTPGIDAAGVVVESSSGDWNKGDAVIVTGYDLGMNTAGGFGQYIRVPADWVVPLPEGLSLKESMIFGTAGFTAAQCVEKLEKMGLNPAKDSEVLVTGATGGVGSLAVMLLSHLGYTVAAATGKSEQHDYLKQLGAKEILDRDEVNDTSDKPLQRERWAGVVDTVGGTILTTAIKSTRLNGSVTSCGLTLSAQLDMTVMPFILRGVNLLGVASALCPMDLRRKLWQNLAGRWKPKHLHEVAETCNLERMNRYIDEILKGRVTGRKILRHDMTQT